MKRPMKRIYLDHASITPIDEAVLKEMMKYSSPSFANPSSIHAEGVAAKRVVAEARKRIADTLHGHPDEILFTGTGTEANNTAIEGLMHDLLMYDLDFKDLHLV